jgi:hypothetical protein
MSSQPESIEPLEPHGPEEDPAEGLARAHAHELRLVAMREHSLLSMFELSHELTVALDEIGIADLKADASRDVDRSRVHDAGRVLEPHRCREAAWAQRNRRLEPRGKRVRDLGAHPGAAHRLQCPRPSGDF